MGVRIGALRGVRVGALRESGTQGWGSGTQGWGIEGVSYTEGRDI